jgi:hypothetical protein
MKEPADAREAPMRMIVPPCPPLVALSDRGGSDRLRLRLHQVTLSAVTVLATAWCVTLGTVPAIISLSIAKHVLVAVLAMGLGVDQPRRAADFDV